LGRQKKNAKPVTEADARRLVHELQVHQIELEMQNEELTQARTEVEAALGRYTDLYDLAPVGYLTLTRNGAIRQVNLTGANLLGVARGELVRRRFGVFVSPSSRTTFNTFLEKVFASGSKETCEVALQKEGTTSFWVNIEAVRSEDGVREREECRAVLTEITERKQAEEMLKESQARFAAIFQTNPGAIALTRLEDNRLVDVNQAWQEATGYTRAEAIGHTPLELNLWVDPAQRERLVNALRQYGKARGEIQIRRKTGEVRDLLMSAEQIELVGERYLLTMAQDITEHKQAEEALRVALAKYQTLFDSFPLGITVSDEAGNILETNPMAGQLLGVPQEEHTQRNIDGAEWRIVRPDGTPMPPGEYASVRALKKQRRVENVELGIVKPDDTTTWLSVTAAPLPLEGYGVVVTYGDITERKRAEAALRESEERHRQVSALMSDYIYCGLASADGGSVIEWVSGAFERITGYSMEEVNCLPGGFSALLLPEDFVHVIRQQPRLFEQGSLSTEYRIRRKDGEVLWLRDYMRFVSGTGFGKPAKLLGAVQDITERKQAEEEINSARAFLEMIVNMSPFAMWISDMNGTVTRVNRSLCEAINLTETEIVGKYNVLKDENLEIQGVMPAVRAVFERHEPARFIIPWKAANAGDASFSSARNMHIDVSMFPILDTKGVLTNVVCQWVDITERKRAEEALRESEEKYRHLFSLLRRMADTMPDMLWAKNCNFEYIFANQSTCKNLLNAADTEEPLGKTDLFFAMRERQSHPDTPDWHTFGELCRDSDSITMQELTLMQFDEFGNVKGEFLYLDVHKAPLFDADGQLIGVVGSARDVTARKKAEEQLAHYTEKLEEMVEARTRELREAQEKLIRQEKLAVLGQLAGGVGHELRNPLAVINNAVYFLKLIQPQADEKVKEYLRLIERETHNADKIINDLLDFSRVKSMQREPASVADLLARVLERFPAPAAVQVTLDLPGDLPPVYADPRQVEQVLGNLVVNACQAMPQGGQLSVFSEQCSVDSEQWVLIRVKDTGVGIPPENLDKIFEPLFTTKVKGIGLGLAVSQKLIEANGGRLEVQSAPGMGSTFTLYLPVYIVPEGGIIPEGDKEGA